MTLAELGERMSGAEFMAWRGYDAVEPIGAERVDLAAGIVASTVANASRDAKRTKAFKPSDFMPLAPQPEPDGERAMREWLAAIGAKTKRGAG